MFETTVANLLLSVIPQKKYSTYKSELWSVWLAL
jgi:hypothetical protein